jgi:hypothetical protein
MPILNQPQTNWEFSDAPLNEEFTSSQTDTQDCQPLLQNNNQYLIMHMSAGNILTLDA